MCIIATIGKVAITFWLKTYRHFGFVLSVAALHIARNGGRSAAEYFCLLPIRCWPKISGKPLVPNLPAPPNQRAKSYAPKRPIRSPFRHQKTAPSLHHRSHNSVRSRRTAVNRQACTIEEQPCTLNDISQICLL